MFEPGVFFDMPNDDYQAAPAISKSRLDVVEKSERHYYGKYIDPEREPEEKTEALILGDAIHNAVLTPFLFEQGFTTPPKDAPKRPSITQINAKNPSPETREAIAWWDNYREKNSGKVFLKDDDFSLVCRIRDAILIHPKASALFSGGHSEVSYFAHDPETGAPIKARADYLRLNDGMIVDLKTTEDASPAGFGRSAEKYRYYVQGAWYQDVLTAHYGGQAIEHFVFVAVEKSPPFAIGIYWMTPRDFAEGREDARANLHQIIAAERSGIWPDYGFTPQPLQRPNWRRNRARK